VACRGLLGLRSSLCVVALSSLLTADTKQFALLSQHSVTVGELCTLSGAHPPDHVHHPHRPRVLRRRRGLAHRDRGPRRRAAQSAAGARTGERLPCVPVRVRVRVARCEFCGKEISVPGVRRCDSSYAYSGSCLRSRFPLRCSLTHRISVPAVLCVLTSPLAHADSDVRERGMCARSAPGAEGALLCIGVRALPARGSQCVELHYRGEWFCRCSVRCACASPSYALFWRVRAAYPVKDSCLGCLSALRSPAIVAYRPGRGCCLEYAGCDRARAEALGPQPDRGKGFALRRTGTQGRIVSTVLCGVWGGGLCACCWPGVAARCGAF
jgi:hypothetical protein